MQFRDIPGHHRLKKLLIQSIQQGHIPHAQLFNGATGSANMAMALAMAQFVQCEAATEEDSCGKCFSCHKHKKLIHPDLHFVFPIAKTAEVGAKPTSQDFMNHWRPFLTSHPYPSLSDWLEEIQAENKQANIPVEESRQVIRMLSLKSYESQYKILVLWLPEMMKGPAANALLKVLEEPPAFTLFLLVGEDEKKLITTIRSRVQMIQIPAFTDSEVSTYLQHTLMLSGEQAKDVAYLADGNLHLALKLAQNPDDSSFVFFRDWMREVYMKNITGLVARADEFSGLKKESQKLTIEYGINLLREVLLWHSQSTGILRQSGEQLKFVQGLSKTLKPSVIELFFKLLNEALIHLERNANMKITFLDISLKIIPLMHTQ